jgi:60 kDa SS-A/Ro ribonucleoprotein
MSKFNATLQKPKAKTQNLAGGQAYKQSDKLALISLLLTSFVNDQFYRKADQTLEELRNLVNKIEDKSFLAKAAIYARDNFGMRSTSHALAGELTSHISGQEWAKSFYDKVVVRVDDMAEIMSYYLMYKTNKSNPKFPNSLKKGFAKAFNKFDDFQLSKYVGNGKDLKLVDIVNLVHPIPTDRNKTALGLLVKGELKNTQTWESKLSQAGQLAQNEEELSNLKSEAWSELIETRKLGYFALLKNLRNIIEQSPKSIVKACEMLVDENLIKKSRVMPFRFATAYEEISKLPSTREVRDVLVAINVALEKSVSNVPKLEGETLVVLDVSGSMSGKPSDIASLFASILLKSNNCDIMTFANSSSYKSYNPNDSLLTIRDGFRFSGGGTNIRSVFTTANKSYDNIIILSDFQAWIGHETPVADFNKYKSKYNCNPNVFSWDLNGYSTMQFPENNVFCLAGFSEKVFDVMEVIRKDKTTLVKEIESIQL